MLCFPHALVVSQLVVVPLAFAARVVPVAADRPALRHSQRRAIVGGTAVRSTENFSFFVQAPGARCGGVLVAMDVVLTSSACSALFQDRALVGSTARNGDGSSEGQWRKVDRDAGARHPEADPSRLRDGPALFRIEPVTLEGVHPAQLNWEAAAPVLGQALTVAGFGLEVAELPAPANADDDDDYLYYSSDGDYFNHVEYLFPNQLVKATVRAPDRDVCRAMGEYYIRWPYVDSKMMCTLADDRLGRGPCTGDAGGPLVDEEMNLVGIVSDVKECNKPNSPSFYFRISGYKAWIQETMCQLTTDRSALPFECPAFLCPLDVVVLGFPSSSLPTAFNLTRAMNNYAVTEVEQSPEAGTHLPNNSTTVVNVTATDASGKAVACKWTVEVPPFEEVAFASFDVPGGSVNTTSPVALNYNNPAGDIYGMQVYANYFTTENYDDGDAPVYNVSLAVTLLGGGKSLQSTFTLSADQPKGSANFSVPVAFSSGTDSDATIVVTVLESSVGTSIADAGSQLTGQVQFFGQRKH